MEEKLEIFEFFSFGKCRIVPENVKGDHLGFINIHLVAKYEKTRKGRDTFETLKIFRKKSHSAEKNRKAGGTLLVPSGFVGYLEKVKNERGNPWTKFALAGLGLRWFQDCF